MVEYNLLLDDIFGALAHPIRRHILERVARGEELTISQIAEPFKLTFAAISKHLMVLEKARLIVKRRQGKEQVVRVSPAALANAAGYLKEYERLWNDRLDSLEQYLATLQADEPKHKRA